MSNQFLSGFLFLLLFTGNPGKVSAPTAADEMICGKWESAQKNIIVQVYKDDNNQFKGKIVWFNDGEGNKKMATWTDVHNPDPALRSRKILGLNVLEKLTYNPKSNSWEDGMIYDAKSGRKWNSSAYLAKDGSLKVKGYWHVKFIGKTMTFHRYTD
ncbi:DUF2147 domain-containing protein [Inquilinus sp. KBS0705]|nr:DUF2147 domain-containing protein [Inquilinus sp. KBS0705]